MYTEEQIVTIQPNESTDGVVLKIGEANGDKSETRLYLSYDEAIILAKQIADFVDERDSPTVK